MTSLRWQTVITDAGYHLRLKGANNEIILSSEVYTNRGSALASLALVRKSIDTFSANEPDIIDERSWSKPQVQERPDASA